MVVEENEHRGSVVVGMNRCSASKDYKRMQLNFFLPETTVTSSPVVVGTWLEEGSFDNMMSSESDGAEVGVERTLCNELSGSVGTRGDAAVVSIKLASPD